MSNLSDRFPALSELRVAVHVGNLGEAPGEFPTTIFDLDSQPHRMACPNCRRGEMDVAAKVLDVLGQGLGQATVHALCDGQEQIGNGFRKCVYRAHIEIHAVY